MFSGIDFSESFFNRFIELEHKHRGDKNFLEYCSLIFEKLNEAFIEQIYYSFFDYYDFIEFEGKEDDMELIIRGTVRKDTEKYSNIFKRIEGILLHEIHERPEDSAFLELVNKSWIEFEKTTNDALNEKLAKVLSDRFFQNLSDKDKVRFYCYMKDIKNNEEN